jgi:hypothetical protein
MSQLADAFARGQAAYPRLKLAPESFSHHLASLVDARRNVSLEGVPIEDLFLACACATGVKGAAASFFDDKALSSGALPSIVSD